MIVDKIIIVELGENFTGIAQQNFNQTFFDGDSFEYISSIFDDSSTVPKGIQVNMFGQNAAGDAIISTFLIQFTNNCSFYPVFEEGFSLGWTNFVSGVLKDLFRESSFSL